MWVTFKSAFCIFISWHFIKWRFTLWSNRRRRRNKAKVKQLTPGQAVERMTAKLDTVIITANDNTVPPVTPAPPAPQQRTTPPAPQAKRRNSKMINEVTSAMVNLGMAKRKAKQHVQQCYDNMNGKPSLNALLVYSIKSLST
jgi:hypothetical protein